MSRQTKPCKIEGCTDPARTRGWCIRHYSRWLKWGDPNRADRDMARFGEPKAFVERMLTEDVGDECINWPYSVDNWGRPQIAMATETGRRTFKVGSLICEAAQGPRPAPKSKAIQTCGLSNKLCVNRNHFRWGDQKEVEFMKIDVDRSNRGEGNGMHKLTEDEVIDIKYLSLSDDMSDSEIGAVYGVTRKAIARIRRGTGWRHLFEDNPDTNEGVPSSSKIVHARTQREHRS